MKWLNILIFISIIFYLPCSSSYFKSSEQVLFDKVIAASKTEDSSNLSDIDYDQIAEYLSEGKTHWIALYPTLNKRPFLGATSFQEGLNISMAYALPENPSEVLKFVNEKNINAICGAPFIEPTPDEMNHYFSKTSMAINQLASGGYWKNSCLFNLNRAIAHATSTIR